MQAINTLIGDGHNDANSVEIGDPNDILLLADDIDHSNNNNSSQHIIGEDEHNDHANNSVNDDEIIEIGDHTVNVLADDQSNNHDSSSSCQQNYVEPAPDEQHAADSNEIACNIKALAHKVKGKLESAPPSDFAARHCIHRVHEKFRKINESAYMPAMVSIGPFHCGKQSLRAMQECKLIYMRDLLSRTAKTGGDQWSTILEECVESIKSIEEEARSCYSEPINLSSDEFVEMMVVDGLFIIELFRRRADEVTYDNDPVFSSIWHILSLIRDMALLENQLPMLVLDCLFNLPSLREELQDSSFTTLALNFFDPLMPRDDEVLEQYSNYEGNHLLDLLAKTFHPTSSPRSAKKMLWGAIPSVTELNTAGVEFKKGSTKGSFLDINFSGGVLKIPPLVIQDSTDSLLRNLIAYEQCSDGDVDYFTSYASLMDDLINSGTDVGFLRKQGIITNYLGSDEDISNLFNKLCYEVSLTDYSCYSELYKKVNTYYTKRRHVWRATLKRDYFHSPWSIISVVAAILLLGLTLTATVFAILSFFIHKS